MVWSLVPAATLLALVDATPAGPGWARRWVTDILSQHLPGFSPDSGACGLHGWSVGTVVADEPLAQSRPFARTGNIAPLDDLLRVPGRCIIAALDARPANPAPLTTRPGAEVYRFRRWVSLHAPRELPADCAAEMSAELPEFLARGRRERADGELVLLTFVAQLQRVGGLRPAYATPEQIHAALRHVDERLAGLGGHCLMVSDGHTLGVACRGGNLLAFEPPEDVPRATIGLHASPGGPPAKLLLHLPPAILSPPRPALGAERIADGCLTIDAHRPWRMQRA
jgi:hypothetical protein